MSHTTDELKRNDNQFIHPWEDLARLDQNKRTVLAKGEGVYVTDSDGKRLLDGPGGMWCVNIGHGREEMAQAIYDQIMQLPYASPWSLATGPAALFSAALAKESPGDLNHVFFTTGGSTAVDSALRFVQFYNNVRGKPKKKHIISHQKGYHGSTYLAASVSGKERDKNHLDFVDSLVHHIPAPHPLHRTAEQSDAEFLDQCVANLENQILETGKRLLDGPGGMWCVNIGHGREEMAQAIYDQIMQLPYASPWSLATGPAALFSAALAKESPGDLNHVFFTTGGSTAVDSALRFVQFYNNVRGKPKKKHIISHQKGYHGSTYLAASVSGKRGL